MKKLLFVLFLVLSANAFAKDSLLSLLKNQPFDLTRGITLKESTPLNDFTTLYATPTLVSNSAGLNISWYEEEYAKVWYNIDFAEDPFDGMIEIFVVGEPLPSTTITLIISALVCLLLLKNKIGLLKC